MKLDRLVGDRNKKKPSEFNQMVRKEKRKKWQYV